MIFKLYLGFPERKNVFGVCAVDATLLPPSQEYIYHGLIRDVFAHIHSSNAKTHIVDLPDNT